MQLGLTWTALELASVSVRSGDCLSAFVYLVKGSNSWIGYVQGINGIMQVFTFRSYACMSAELHAYSSLRCRHT